MALAQYDDEKDASIPLDKFYIKRKGVSPFRYILSKVHLGLSTGYGRTYFSHKLDGYGILQQPDSLPKLFDPVQFSSGYSNWITRSTAVTNSSLPGEFLVSSDTTELGFKSKAFSIPFKATLHVEFSRYHIRVGGGYSTEYMRIGQFVPISYGNDIQSFKLAESTTWMKKYFVMLGGMVYRYNVYSLVVDANVGGYKFGSTFDKSVIKRSMYVNVGASIEREMSEYFRLFVRPSFELKNYKLTTTDLPEIKHRANALYLNIGATYRMPELRRCVFKSCKAQINHAHGNREYRSRVHPIYKKQNPHYGENYPTLLKYKGKNKKKLNPY